MGPAQGLSCQPHASRWAGDVDPYSRQKWIAKKGKRDICAAIFHMHRYVGRIPSVHCIPCGGTVSRRGPELAPGTEATISSGEKRRNVNLTEALHAVSCPLFFRWGRTIGRCWRSPGADCVWFLGRSAISLSRRFMYVLHASPQKIRGTIRDGFFCDFMVCRRG